MILKVDNFRILLHKLFFLCFCIYAFALVKNNKRQDNNFDILKPFLFRSADINFTNRVDVEKLLQIVLFLKNVASS